MALNFGQWEEAGRILRNIIFFLKALDCHGHTIRKNMGVNNSTNIDSKGNEDHERKNLYHLSKFLNFGEHS